MNNTISLRSRENGDEGIMKLDTFIERINEEIEKKK